MIREGVPLRYRHVLRERGCCWRLTSLAYPHARSRCAPAWSVRNGRTEEALEAAIRAVELAGELGAKELDLVELEDHLQRFEAAIK